MMYHMKKPTRYFHAGGITIQLDSEIPVSWGHTLAEKFTLFEVENPGPDTVQIIHHLGEPPRETLQGNFKTVLDNETWKILISESSCIYEYQSKHSAAFPYTVTNIFTPDHRRGDVYFKGIDIQKYHKLQLASLTGLGTDQILLAKLLADRKGFLFHANGVFLNDKTLLFTGKSGIGKSTISGMMKTIGGKTFCDDRIMVKKTGDKFTASGSWIPYIVTSDAVFTKTIDAVFFLEQSLDNKISPISKTTLKYENAMQSLVKNFLVPDQWVSTLGLMETFVKTIPFYSLKFTLTNEICNVIIKEINCL